MNITQAKRLMRLARFLHNKLPEEKFDFRHILRGSDIPNKTFSCGTVGCAIGWSPLVFPTLLEYKHTPQGNVMVVSKECNRALVVSDHVVSDTVKDFFGLWEFEAKALFVPGQQDGTLPRLTSYSKPKDVAINIALFVGTKCPEVNNSLA